MFDIELIEGKYYTGYKPPDKYDKIGIPVGLLVHICCHIYYTGKVVIVYGGFCVLQGVIKLVKLGGGGGS